MSSDAGYLSSSPESVCASDSESTEVRCSEQAKGGLKYELVLSEPALEPPKLPNTPSKTSLSIEEIQSKLKAAEERRQSLEAEKMTQLTQKLSQIDLVKDKKTEFNNNFMQSTKESLEQKMEAQKENREAHLKSIQDKVHGHVLKVEEVKKMADSPKLEILEAIQKKLNNASESREAQLSALLERLKEHDKHIAEARKQTDEQIEQLRERLTKKLEIAREKRESIIKEIQEKRLEHERHVEEVRQNKTVTVNASENSSG